MTSPAARFIRSAVLWIVVISAIGAVPFLVGTTSFRVDQIAIQMAI